MNSALHYLFLIFHFSPLHPPEIFLFRFFCVNSSHQICFSPLGPLEPTLGQSPGLFVFAPRGSGNARFPCKLVFMSVTTSKDIL
jgi:hypothetical protein